jgi:ATP-dependent exoDNAse (exonuclease V) alpha subunit
LTQRGGFAPAPQQEALAPCTRNNGRMPAPCPCNQGDAPRYPRQRWEACASMASYHLSATPVQRSKGHSVVAAAAYRAGDELRDERTGQTHDYTRKGGVLEAAIIAPDNAPAWARDRQELWNHAEAAERQHNGQPAREIRVALPHELTDEQRAELVFDFCRDAFVKNGMIADICIHRPDRHGDDRNEHAHILLTMRKLDGEKFATRKEREWNSKEALSGWREQWAEYQNRALEKAGFDIRVDHRSYAERGIEREPTTHLGRAASQMERRGEHSDRGDINRQAEHINELIEARDGVQDAIVIERERISSPPSDPVDALERMREAAEPFREAIETHGAVPNIESDGLSWWQRLGMQLTEKARNFAIALAQKARYFWQSREHDRSQQPEPEHDHDDRGIEP